MNRRALFTDDRDLAALVRQATSVAPSGELLDRVQASRADGMRVVLPNGDAATAPIVPPVRSSAIETLSVEQLAGRVWMIGIAVAATMLAAVMSMWPDQTAQDALPSTATAQRNAPYPSFVALDDSRLKPGRRSYLRSVGNTMHALLPSSTYTVELDSAVLDQQRTWCLVTVTQTSTGLSENNERDAQYDSVWLRRDDLRPVRRSSYAGYLRMRQTFTDSSLAEIDSIVSAPGTSQRNGALNGPTFIPFGKETIKTLDAQMLYVPTEETMRLLLRAAPLHKRWRASVGLLSGDSRTFAAGTRAYLNLRVDGTRNVQTLSGQFATWRVVLETGATPEVWYVSKETGETLLTEGSWSLRYPVSETRLLYGFEETKRASLVREREW